MARLLRPYIPLDIRLGVALRDLGWRPVEAIRLRVAAAKEAGTLADELADTLAMLSAFHAGAKLHLDHDPPLAARKKLYWRDVHIGYDPPANDPRFLIYRTVEDHRQKTNVRGEHGQHPDRVLIKKARRAERRHKRTHKKRRKMAKRLWASRPLRSGNRLPGKGARTFRRRS